MDDIDRTMYVGKIFDFIGNRNAKVIAGVRRCGKSTFMRSISKMISSKQDTNIIYIEMDLFANRALKDANRLYEKIKNDLVKDKKNVLFIDEIQDVEEWESVIRSLITENVCDIFITGSNSKLLSSEYATYLSGRINTMEMFPLSFRECIVFNSAYGVPMTDDELLQKFIAIGGFPGLWQFNMSYESSYSELHDILDTVVTRDIVKRYGIKNEDLLKRILLFICDNLGSYTSLNNIYEVLHSEDNTVTRDTVYAYAGHLESACLIQKARVYNIKGKKLLSERYKYFVTDIGLKHALSGFKADDISGHMENVIYLDLRGRGYNVWVGNNNGKEIDLIAEKFGKKVYVQSVFRFSSDDVIRREFGNLKGIDDNYPRYVVTMDSMLHGDSDGITCCGLAEFLKKEEF